MRLAMKLPKALAPARRAGHLSRALRTTAVPLRVRSQAGSDLPATTTPGAGMMTPFGSPFRMGSLFRDLEQEIDSMMRGFGVPVDTAFSIAPRAAGRALAVDVEDKGDKYLVHADVPGMTKDDIKIEITPDHVLTISGERKSEQRSEEKGVVRMERSYGSFARAFRLPDNVDAEKIKAETKHGVLELSIPKKEGAQEEEKTITIPIEGQ